MEQSKYNSLYEWKLADKKAYEAARNRGMLQNICNMFGWELPLEKSTLNLEEMLKKCEEYGTLTNLRKYNRKLLELARNRGWLDEIYEKMNWERKVILNKKPKGYWTKKTCIENALKYKTKKDWENANGSSYSVSRHHGWYDECTAHMEKKINSRGYWTLKLCKEDALNYNTQEKWKKSYGAYNAARKNKWIEECCKHMIKNRKNNDYWTKEMCIEESSKYKTRSEWIKKSQTSYNKSRKLGCFNECVAHMKSLKKNWTFENCQKDALKYKTRSEWAKKSGASYSKAHRLGWFETCCKHMK